MNAPQMPFALPDRLATDELRRHLSDAAVAEEVEWCRLAAVAAELGRDLEVELGLIRTGPTPRANLRRLALSLT